MAAGEVQVRSLAHSLDQGKFAFCLRAGLFGILIAGLSLQYFSSRFHGLGKGPDSATAVADQAEIARHLAAGSGSSTRYIRPLALAMLQSRQGENTPIDHQEFPDFLRNASALRGGSPHGASLLRAAK